MTDPDSAPLQTPLQSRHEALGARLIEFSGWLMPVQYTSILEEHRAVRERCGLFDLSHMGELFVDGRDAGAALATALVTDPPSLAVGRAHYSMICAADGGIIDDLIVYRLADERFLVVANAGNASVVSDALAERLRGSAAILDDRSLAMGLVAIQGPRAIDALRPLTDVDLEALRYYAIAEGTVAGIPALVARTGYTGEDGFEVFVDTARTGELWDALLVATHAHDGLPVGLGARDTLRLEAGMPLYGNELDRTTTPFDAGLGRVVKLGKPRDFVGRAALETGRSRRPESPARGSQRGRSRDRPARLPDPSRGPAPRGGDQRHAIADARGADRDGLRHPGRWRAGYSSGHRDPWGARPSEGRRPALLPSPRLTAGIRRRFPPAMVPAELRYTKDHEWVRLDGDTATVGITQYAADQLGDIVFVELPDVGRVLEQFAAFGVVESVKAVSDLFAPLSGEILATNPGLAGSPETVNSDPYGEGWMVRLRVTDEAQSAELLDAAAYDDLVAAG